MLIHNAKIVTWGSKNQVLEGQAVLIRDGLIAEIGPERELKDTYPAEESLDAAGQYLMPGNICAHTHFYGAYARGMAIPGDPPKDFPEILNKLWWPLDKALDEETVRFSALIHLVDAIKHGSTTLIDHHASPNAIPASLDVIAQAVKESGLRSVLCYEVTDRDGEGKAQAGIQENLRFISKIADGDNANGRLAATFGLHASLTLSDETLAACRTALPISSGFHVHVAEHEADQEDSLAKSGKRVVQRLADNGILGPRSIIAHAIHIDDAEIKLIAESNTWVTHQPRSNMNNGVGVAEVERLLEAGVKVCLGNDGFTQDMWTEWKEAYLLHKLAHRDPRRMNGMDVIQMGVHNNAALAQHFFPGATIGEVSQGARADLILVDYHPHTPLTAGNLPWHILFGFNESMLTMTMVDGQVLMKDGKLTQLDEKAIAQEAMQLAPGLWKRYEKFAQ